MPREELKRPAGEMGREAQIGRPLQETPDSSPWGDGSHLPAPTCPYSLHLGKQKETPSHRREQTTMVRNMLRYCLKTLNLKKIFSSNMMLIEI